MTQDQHIKITMSASLAACVLSALAFAVALGGWVLQRVGREPVYTGRVTVADATDTHLASVEGDSGVVRLWVRGGMKPRKLDELASAGHPVLTLVFVWSDENRGYVGEWVEAGAQ